jgi:malate synthase
MEETIRLQGPVAGRGEEVLTRAALDFVAGLERRFRSVREDLLLQRERRQDDFDRGILPGFRDDTREVRAADWRVSPAPPDLTDRRVEITGPVERKMMINALNSGARVFMADFEDSLSPTWPNIVEGQANLIDAVRRELEYDSPEGKRYRLNQETATLLVRPRGWHLSEKHLHVDGAPVSASLFDFGLYFFHNAAELLARGSGPYFYLPKLEGYHEAQLWNEVFLAAQDELGIPRGTIRATVLIETILAAFEMDEILYALREHAAGLNAGRWDYIFSIIRKFRSRDFLLPDRAQVTMGVPFMRAYTELLVATCHRREAHAIGGMAAFIPSRRDKEVNRVALAKVREDKEREAAAGFDGTWVAHPDLVPVAGEVFDRVLEDRPHQKHRLRDDVAVAEAELLDFQVPGGTITEQGVRNNVTVALQYLDSWLHGQGAAGILNLMEDAATAEIARSQLWQWVWREAPLNDGRRMSQELYGEIRNEELDGLGGAHQSRLAEAAQILDDLVLTREFQPFLTLLAYDRLP